MKNSCPFSTAEIIWKMDKDAMNPAQFAVLRGPGPYSYGQTPLLIHSSVSPTVSVNLGLSKLVTANAPWTDSRIWPNEKFRNNDN
jgi:hypothetical protein